MSQSDWGVLSGSLVEASVKRGPTAGLVPPNGGGSHVFGFTSVDSEPGVVGLYCLQPNFSPVPGIRGGRITAAIRRTSIGAATGFSPFLFFAAQSAAVGGAAYILGLSDEASSKVQLRKGTISGGVAAVADVNPLAIPNTLMRSTNGYPADEWQHLRLDVVLQGTGDAILQVYRNNLQAHSVSSPVWEAIPGMEGPYSAFAGFVDDALGVNTGSVPIAGGYMGFGARFDAANRATYFDHVTVDRQL